MSGHDPVGGRWKMMFVTHANVAIIRRAALIFLPFAAIGLVVTYLLYAGQASVIRGDAEAAEHRVVENAQQRMAQTFMVILSDVLYVATQDALLTWLDRGDPDSLRHLQNEHFAFVRGRAIYDRMRFLDTAGREIVRVDWNHGSPEIAPPLRLAQNFDQAAFRETLKLDRGQLFLGQLMMGADTAAEGEPLTPVIRIAAPVFDNSGSRRGVMILTYRGQRLIDRITSLNSEASDVWLTDESGNWLIGPAADGKPAFQPAATGGQSFATSFPDIWRQMHLDGAAAPLSTADGRFTYTKIGPADYRPLAAMQAGVAQPVMGPSWVTIVHTPRSAMWAQTSNIRRDIVLAVAVLLLLLAAAAWGLARHQLHRQDAERRIRLNEARFRDLLESAPDAVIITDSSGQIELVNAQVERLFGYPRQELIGRSIDMLVPDGLRDRHEAHRRTYIDAARTRQMGPNLDLRGARKDGSDFPISVSLSPTRTDKGLTVFCDIRDMTAQRKTEQKIQELNRRLVQDNAELEALNRELEAFSYSVSHDLRAPLRAIDGFSQALQEDVGDKLDDNSRSYLERVRQAAQRMGLLIDDLLKLSSVSRVDLNRCVVDLTAVAGEILHDLSTAEPQRIAAAEVAPGLRANADPRLLRIALENLLSNAWKFTAPRSPATIIVGQELTEAGPAFFVRDNGVGFDMAQAGRLFRPFQRLHEARQFPGTGIGLATTQRVIRRHGGEIWASARSDGGAAFYFTLE